MQSNQSSVSSLVAAIQCSLGASSGDETWFEETPRSNTNASPHVPAEVSEVQRQIEAFSQDANGAPVILCIGENSNSDQSTTPKTLPIENQVNSEAHATASNNKEVNNCASVSEKRNATVTSNYSFSSDNIKVERCDGPSSKNNATVTIYASSSGANSSLLEEYMLQSTEGLAILNAFDRQNKTLDVKLRRRLCRLVVKRDFESAFQGLKRGEKLNSISIDVSRFKQLAKEIADFSGDKALERILYTPFRVEGKEKKPAVSEQ